MKYFLLLTWLLTSCVGPSDKNEADLFRNVAKNASREYYIDKDAPPHVHKLMGLAVGYWNSHLGENKLKIASRLSRETVQVSYSILSKGESPQSHTQLLGCTGFGRILTNCKIVVEVPHHRDLLDNLPKYIHLYQKGPIDKVLVENISYHENPTKFFQDKMTLITMIHEIGHTMGLGHSHSQDCLMAAIPSGKSGFCKEELTAARQLHIQ